MHCILLDTFKNIFFSFNSLEVPAYPQNKIQWYWVGQIVELQSLARVRSLGCQAGQRHRLSVFKMATGLRCPRNMPLDSLVEQNWTAKFHRQGNTKFNFLIKARQWFLFCYLFSLSPGEWKVLPEDKGGQEAQQANLTHKTGIKNKKRRKKAQ